ncbi:hypothetical protein BGY98DRAFT_940126 [Russula aff. rugulosa BPL654]|nr:hypothetical protein BGY98DRAFT_940126 [Russula aff. rugulosa BPL654]
MDERRIWFLTDGERLISFTYNAMKRAWRETPKQQSLRGRKHEIADLEEQTRKPRKDVTTWLLRRLCLIWQSEPILASAGRLPQPPQTIDDCQWSPGVWPDSFPGPRDPCTRGSPRVLNEPPSSSQPEHELLIPAALMSNSHPITTASSSSNFQLIFNNALKAYERRTKKDLLAHPLAAELQNCNSPSEILAILYQQVQGLDQSMSSDDRWTKWLDPTVNVLYMLSKTLGEGISLVFSPGKVIFAGVGVLLLAAKNTRKSHETLIEIFVRIESFFRRLSIYTQVPSTPEMLDTIIRIMVEVLTILGIATKEMKQGRIKKYGKRLLGKNDMEDALKKLDRLTQEEAQMTIAENLRATHAVNERVRGDTERVLDGVGNVNDKVAEVIHVLAMEPYPSFRKPTAGLRHKWLSPPDPSTNHNIACGTHHKKAATWFFQGNIYKEWKSKGSLMWIHGKPGSGKSILCSTVIEDIKALCDAGQASMGFFYFDFRNANKQSLRDLLPSLLTQLSARSSPRCDILSELYSVHDNGKNQPSDIVLTKCLQDMLSLPDQSPIYLIMDALDESPVTSEIPPARERVLQLLKELVDLGLPNLHICITSRPEIDIRNAIEPLTSLRVSLHDETGQKEDIADYVSVDILSIGSPKGLSSIERPAFLDELPESLDETYERVLKEIKKPNREHARRLLQCLVVAIRPLRVEELAEVLAIDFNDAEGVPKLNPSWRWEDQERALLTSCSSLIAIVDTGVSRVVQFSHFSVKEYLTSERLATSSQGVSRYHITFETAHTILAQACVSVLLQLDDHDEQDDVEKKAPLAVYAAEYWVRHAQFEDVVSRIKGMEDLFDVDKPYFAAWRELHDIDIIPPDGSVFSYFAIGGRRRNIPLYYAALCGFANLVEQLIAKHPQHVNTIGGLYRTPAVAALAGRHFEVAQVLHRNKSSLEPRGFAENTPLHSAARYGDLEMVQVLLEFGVDVDPKNSVGQTPLDYASADGHRNDARVARVLIAHGADPNSRAERGFTPLHQASMYGRIEIVTGSSDILRPCGLPRSYHLHHRGPILLAPAPPARTDLVDLPPGLGVQGRWGDTVALGGIGSQTVVIRHLACMRRRWPWFYTSIIVGALFSRLLPARFLRQAALQLCRTYTTMSPSDVLPVCILLDL